MANQPLKIIKTDLQKKIKILAVDDDRTALFLLATQLEDMGYHVVTAKNGIEACSYLKENKDIELILLDLEMPQMNGMQVVVKLKEDASLAQIPVIMQTGHDKPEQIREGIDLGVFYYLTKPLIKDVLKSVISAAIRDAEQKQLLREALDKQKNSFGMIENCNFTFSKLNEAEQLATFLASLYPSPDRSLMGIAELLINAVEHGNLGLHYNDKTKHVAAGTWRDEVNRRQALPENSNKKVSVIFARKKEGLYLRITDQGAGFDWRSYMQIDPSRASDNHGRGIALANMVSFDKLSYNDVGNEVTAFANFSSELEW